MNNFTFHEPKVGQTESNIHPPLKPLIAQRYISDNPFRLLGIGSASPQVKLRAKAQRLLQGIKIGRTDRIGLSELFGIEDGTRITDLVKKIANDAKSRTVHRIMWPLAYESPTNPRGLMSDFDVLIQNSGGTIYGQQTEFLSEWFLFLYYKNIDNLHNALSNYAKLYDDGQIDQVLMRLLEEEGEANPVEICNDALDETTQYILTSSVAIAVEKWELNDWQNCINILKAVREANFDIGFTANAMDSVASVVDRECSKLDALRLKFHDWQPNNNYCALDEAQRLFLLANTIEDLFVSRGVLWLKSIQDYTDTVGIGMRSYAIEIANTQENYEEALLITKQIIHAPVSEKFKEQLVEDIIDLTENIQKYQSTLLPPKNNPQQSPVRRDNSPNSPAGKHSIVNELTFVGRKVLAPLVGYAIFIGICIAIGVISTNNPPKTNQPSRSAVYSGQSTSNSSNPPFLVPSVTSDANDEQKFERRNSLIQEANNLVAEIDATKVAISAEIVSINQARTNLEAVANRLTSEHTGLDRSNALAVMTYNNHVNEYESARHSFNQVVDRHNEKVRHNNALVRRYNEITQALQVMGN